MRQRTTSRSRARSQTSSSAEEEDVHVGLRRFLGKLRQHQPFYTEEDVAAIPYPSDNGSSCGSSPSSSAPVSPRLSPSRLDNEDSQVQQGATETPAASSSASQDLLAKDKKLASNASKSATAAVNHSLSSSIDLDGPLSPALFVTAVNLFDAKMISKSKRVSTDAIKLVRQAYAFIWKDADYLATLLNGEPYNSASSGGGSHRGRGAAAADLVTGRRSSHGARRVPFASSAPSPSQPPARQLALLLDECVRVLLVYANVSVNFCHSVSSNTRVLSLLAFVCCAARRLEEEDDNPSTSADIVVGNRNLHAEVASLEQEWQSCGIEGRVADTLQECYLIEFLLDAALPPAVCSSRYDGLLTAVFEKKRRVVSDIVASRAGFAHMMRVAPLRGLCGLANMSAFGDAKLRARLLDKMASEGVVERLASEIASAMEAVLMADVATQPTSSPSKRRRSGGRHGSSPPYQRSRAGTSSPPARPGSPDAPLPSTSAQNGSGVATTPADATRASFGLDRVLRSQTTPVERIGQCVDILMLLSSPNLRPPEHTDASSSSRASSQAAVRATTWASHEVPLHEISLHLLAICFLSKSHARYAELASLQLYAADCVLQWAAYSGTFYSMVVRALDELLDMIEAADKAPPRGRTSPPPRTSRSPARSPPAQKSTPATAATAPGHPLLARLLPGDESGLLPLLTNLLQYTIHAEANTTSVQRWFQFLADRLLTDVFEAPQLTTGRRSTVEWGRQRQGQQHTSQTGSRASSSSPRTPPPSALTTTTTKLPGADQQGSTPVLARDLTRAEVVAAAPYFRFVRQVVEETSWRAGTVPLLSKVVLLAFNVIVTQGHRCNLVFGQACACYDVAAPLLLAAPGTSPPRGSHRSSMERRSSGAGSTASSTYRRSAALLQQRRFEEDEEAQQLLLSQQARDEEASHLNAHDDEEVFIGSAIKRRPSPKRERRKASPKKKPQSPTPESPLRTTGTAKKEEESGASDYSPFISSPSGSPVFYEPYSPTSTDEDADRAGAERCRSPSDEEARGSDLRAALEEAATPPPLPQPASESPEAVTRSWSGRLSLLSLISSFTGRDDAPSKNDE